MATTCIPRVLITAAIYAVGATLSGALFFQYVLGEEPCPLCLLQRAGMFAVVLSGLLCLRFGVQTRFLAMTLMGAFIGGLVASRQILLHIAGPAGSGYGSTVMGLHLYSWSFIVFTVVLLGVAAVLVFMRNDRPYGADPKPVRSLPWWEQGAFWFVGLLLLVNIVGVFVECGLTPCCDDGPCP